MAYTIKRLHGIGRIQYYVAGHDCNHLQSLLCPHVFRLFLCVVPVSGFCRPQKYFAITVLDTSVCSRVLARLASCG